MYDVAIVGAGPAGSSAARELGLHGYRVLLIDKAKFPRDKTCGGLISKKALDLLDYSIKNGVVENRITGVRLFGYGLQSISMASRKPLGCTCSRINFDEFLLENAVSAGVMFRDECKLTGIENNTHTLKLKTNRGIFEARCIIGADGVFSSTAKLSGLRAKWRRWQLGITLSMDMPLACFDTIEANTVEFYCIPVLGGFGWLFPFRQHVNIGIGCSNLKSRKAPGVFDELIKNIANEKHISMHKHRVKGGYLPAGGLNTRVASGRILLVGDAGGFVDPFSGEGIYWAIRSGMLAAKAIRDFFEGRTARLDKPYVRLIRDTFYSEFRYSLALAVVLGTKSIWFNIMKKNPVLGKVFTDVLTRDSVYKAYFKTLFSQFLPFSLKRNGGWE